MSSSRFFAAPGCEAQLFAAIYSVDGGEIEEGLVSRRSRDIQVCRPGATQRAAFVLSKPPLFENEWYGIEKLGERYWIVGRIRLDRRRDLTARLTSVGGRHVEGASDGLLCLHAYAAWGQGFVESLAGDFCFSLWDESRNALISVRDQLGVRCLFHAVTGNRHIVSDSLDWIASREGVGRALDDVWVGDFLGVGRSLDFHRTVYRHVARLPPAHMQMLSAAGACIRRYWQLDVKEPLFLPNAESYEESFRVLLASVVADRLPAGKVGIALSGGLDSTALAAFAVSASGAAQRVVAECMHFEHLMPDDEARLCSLVAQHLGLDLQLRAVDDLKYDPQWRFRSMRTAEPTSYIITAHFDRIIAQERAGRAAVWLFGEGPDNALLFERDAYLSWLRAQGNWLRLIEAILLYFKAKGISGWSTTAGRILGGKPAARKATLLPPWLDRGFSERLQLAERVSDANDISDPTHPWHPRAVGSFRNPIWQKLLGDCEREESLAPLVWRHPYLDLRMIEFLLSVPPVPWARRKLLMREAMRDRLPHEILVRNKTPLAGSPLAGPIRRDGLGALSSGDRIREFVEVDRLPAGAPSDDKYDVVLDRIIDAHALDYWLQQTPWHDHCWSSE